MLAPPLLLRTLDRGGVRRRHRIGRRRPRPRRAASCGRTCRRRARRSAWCRAAAALALYTSGSTGVPKEAGRRAVIIERAITALESVFGAASGRRACIATVAHRHVYGLLFRILWPLLERRPFADVRLRVSRAAVGEVGAGNVLISSPAMLKRLGSLPARSGQWRAVFSSGGFLPARRCGRRCARARASRRSRCWAARRRAASRGASRRARASPCCRASRFAPPRTSCSRRARRSPAYDGWQSMGDRVAFDASGGFELLGRADRVAKIEDKRVSLSEIERRLAGALVRQGRRGRRVGGRRAAVRRRRRRAVPPAWQDELAQRGKRAINTALRAALRGSIDPVALPRAFRYPLVDSRRRAGQAASRGARRLCSAARA